MAKSDADAKLQTHLQREAELRKRSLQRTRQAQARIRQGQRQRRAARVVEVGELVAACGLLWVEHARLEALLQEVARRWDGEATGILPQREEV